MRDSRSEHERQGLNARLLRFRAQPGAEDAYALAEDLISQGRFVDARGVARGAQTPGQEDAALLLLEGRAFLAERDLVRAQGVLQRAVRAAPGLQGAYRYLGEVLLKRGDPQRAVKILQRALQLAPDDKDAAALAARAEHLSEAANGDPEALPSLGEAVSQSRPSQRVRAEQEAQAGQTHRAATPIPPRRQRQRAREREEEQPRPREPLPEPYIAKPGEETRPTRRRAPDESTAEFKHNLEAEAAARAQTEEPSESQVKRSIPALPELPRKRESIPQERPMPAERLDLELPFQRAAPALPSLPSTVGAARMAAVTAPAPARAQGRKLPPPSAAGLSVDKLGGEQGRTMPARRTSAGHAATIDVSEAFVQLESDPPPAPLPAARPATIDVSDAFVQLDSEPPRARVKTSAPPPLPPSVAVPAAAAAALEIDVDAAPVLGEALHAAVDPDEVLATVQALGLFEPTTAAAASWVADTEVPPPGQRVRNTLVTVWAAALLLCGVGYGGFYYYVGQRHAQAERWIVEASGLTLRGDHGPLVDAERLLRLAREKYPASTAIPRDALLLQVQRVLDDGEHDTAALHSALARALVAKVEGPAVPLARAWLAAASGAPAERDAALDQTLASAAGDARALYLLGRLEQRVGRPQARSHLQAAAQAQPKLVPAQLALAELAYDEDDRAAAQRYVTAALAQDPQHLHARLAKLLFSADDSDPASLQRELTELAPALEHGANSDRAVAALVKARAARRAGDSATAAAAVTEAGNAGADTAAVLSWVAREALAVGNLTLAQAMASQALITAPESMQIRRLLARILIERRDGEHALQLLEKLPADDVQAQILKAQAALLLSDPEALKVALAGLSDLAVGKRELSTRIAALRVRIEARQNPGPGNVAHAKTLARSAPGDPEALQALAEAGLAARDAAIAQAALKQLLVVTPDDANAHALLGRARRMAADAVGAENSFRRALTLSGHHVEALNGLADLLLDQGRYADADALYQELVMSTSSGVRGRLGRAEALTGLRRFDAARVQLDAVPEAQRNTPAVREVTAKLALASGDIATALRELRALVEAQTDSASLFALYGDALASAQQQDAAGAAYKRALALDGAVPEALLGSAGQQLEARKVKLKPVFSTLERADKALRARIRPPATRARYLVLQARAQLERHKRGDEDAARAALREAVKLPGVANEAFYFLAEAEGGKGHAEARTAYQKYLELEPRGRYSDGARHSL